MLTSYYSKGGDQILPTLLIDSGNGSDIYSNSSDDIY